MKLRCNSKQSNVLTDYPGGARLTPVLRKDYKGMLVREMPGCWSMLLSCDSKVLYSTPFAMDIIGVNDKDLVDQNLRAHIHEADVATYEETIKQLLEQRLDVECIVRFKHAQSKAFRFVELRATPYSGGAGEPVACIVASGKLYPSLYVDVLQTIMDTKLENERLRRLLEVRQLMRLRIRD